MKSNIVFTPAEVSTAGQEYLDFRRTHAEAGVAFPVDMTTPLPGRIAGVYPLLPGEVMSIIARPGHGKTGLMMFWARQRAYWLKEHGFNNRVVVYATWEQSIEELHAFHIAAEQRISITKMAQGKMNDAEWEKSLDASAKRIDVPLWFIGHSVMRKSGRAGITTKLLSDGLESIESWTTPQEVDCVFVDYLQRIASPGQVENPVTAYSKIMDELKDMALQFGSPFVVGVQASREVEKLATPVPEIAHGMWTSNIEQTSDRAISLVRPRKYRREGMKFGSNTVSGNKQLIISVLKQKLAEADFARWVEFDAAYNELDRGKGIENE